MRRGLRFDLRRLRRSPASPECKGLESEKEFSNRVICNLVIEERRAFMVQVPKLGAKVSGLNAGG